MTTTSASFGKVAALEDENFRGSMFERMILPSGARSLASELGNKEVDKRAEDARTMRSPILKMRKFIFRALYSLQMATFGCVALKHFGRIDQMTN